MKDEKFGVNYSIDKIVESYPPELRKRASLMSKAIAFVFLLALLEDMFRAFAQM